MMQASKVNRKYFRQAYRTGIHGWEADEPSPYAVDFLKQLAGVVPGGAMLDIGCGEGRHAIAAATMGFKVIAIDAEPLAIQRAQQCAGSAGLPGIRFQVEHAFRLPFSPASFDIVLDYGCLHHQRKCDWPSYRNSILKALRPTGYYILSVFTPEFRLFAGKTRRWHIADGAYRRCFTRGDLDEFAAGHFEFLAVHEQLPAGFWHALMRQRPG